MIDLDPSIKFDLEDTANILSILGEDYTAESDLVKIKLCIRNLIWITYRKSFPYISISYSSSDHGWGCMIRCGQMILAQILQRKYPNKQRKLILKDFLDSFYSKFSIQNIAKKGETKVNKTIGGWYGPSSISRVLQALSDEIKDPNISNVNIIIGYDSTVYLDKLIQQEPFNGVALFIPLMLGVGYINTIYIKQLIKCIRDPCSVGFIGGKPKRAFWFIGYSETSNQLLYLDPHTTQESIVRPKHYQTNAPSIQYDTESEDEKIMIDSLDFDVESYYPQNIFSAEFSEIDCSLSLAFFFPTVESIHDWAKRMKNDIIENKNSAILSILDTKPQYMNTETNVDPDDEFIVCDSDPEFELIN
ncbi:hypothetical protein A3Q56_04199 [Intoshia linei]|uniref:Cysteine protease n=1 Tax=Intoshia linei TaxID=1819745 RepID=A0A177B3S2_9BILA|nr:hypothetical protein A3Q56_04199 [Intoshia linei]